MTVNTPSAAQVGAATTAITGLVAVVCGLLNVGDMSTPIDEIVTAAGVLFLGIIGHHTTKVAAARALNRNTGTAAKT